MLYVYFNENSDVFYVDDEMPFFLELFIIEGLHHSNDISRGYMI